MSNIISHSLIQVYKRKKRKLNYKIKEKERRNHIGQLSKFTYVDLVILFVSLLSILSVSSSTSILSFFFYLPFSLYLFVLF